MIPLSLAVSLAAGAGVGAAALGQVLRRSIPARMEAEMHAEIADIRNEPAPGELPAWLPRAPQPFHRSWVAETGLALLTAGAVLHFGPTLQALAAIAFLWTLWLAAAIDFDTKLLPDTLTLPLMWGGLLLNLTGMFVPLPQAVAGAALGYLSLWGLNQIARRIIGRDGMGYGDFKLLAAFGAWFGYGALPGIVFLACLTGSLVWLTLLASRKTAVDAETPFGPALALGAVVHLFGGPVIQQLLLGPL